MNRLRLCHDSQAKQPYYIETIGKNIYNMEELCFYLWNYVHLLDDTILDEKLAEWIDRELGMEELADEAKRIIRDKDGMEDFVSILLNSIHYLSESEMSCYIQNLKKMKNMTPFERNKRKADDLVLNKKYYKALQEYGVLLRQPEAKADDMEAKLYHNMGVAYSRMFFFKKASECFLKAFLKVPSKESMRQYKLAVKLCGEELEEDELVLEFPSSESMDLQIYQELQDLEQETLEKCSEIAGLRHFKDEGKVAEYYKKLEEILQTWRGECREYMEIR